MVPEGWEKARFEEVTRIANGQVDPKVEPYSSMLHIGPENVTSHSGQLSGCKTGKELGLISGKYEFDEQAIVYSKIRPNLNKVCRPKFHGLCSADMYPIWANEGLDIDYLYHYMLSPGFFKTAIAMSMRTGMPKINRSDLNAVRIVLPPLAEQKKIAQILSTWDQAITTTERLLENSQQRKKGLMQQLLTGKKRLVASDTQLTPKKTRTGDIPGDWEYPKIAELCTQITDKNSDDQQYPVLACSKHYGFVDSLSYFKKRVYSEDLTGYRVIPRGCIGFPANHVEEGSIGLQNLYDFGLVSPIYVVARPDPKKVNADYLYAVLKTDHYRQIFSAATNASVDRRGSLRWKEFSQIRIPLPSLAEQNEIAEFLKLATSGIDALETDLELLKQEKRALMQQLLTGKRRVKVDSDAD